MICVAGTRVRSGAGGIELPARGVVGEIFLGPGQYHARADGIEHRLRHDHKRHLVLGAGSGVQLLEQWLVSQVYLDGGAFKDDYIIARVEMDGYGGILGQVARFARRADGTEVDGTVDPEAPDRDGVRAAVGA